MVLGGGDSGAICFFGCKICYEGVGDVCVELNRRCVCEKEGDVAPGFPLLINTRRGHR
jgi:hypothetical protein